MTLTEPFHTTSQRYPASQLAIFHDNSDCGHGKEIRPEDRIAGEGGLFRCDRCTELDDPRVLASLGDT
jgi:hypothetical protein